MCKSFADVEEMDSDEFEDVGPMVSIGSSRVPYNSITSEMVAAMTPLEKEEYIRIGQQLYENIYEWLIIQKCLRVNDACVNSFTDDL